MMRIKEKRQEQKDKKTYMKILQIQDKHVKDFFDMDGCGLEIEFGVVYEARCRVYIETGLKKLNCPCNWQSV